MINKDTEVNRVAQLLVGTLALPSQASSYESSLGTCSYMWHKGNAKQSGKS